MKQTLIAGLVIAVLLTGCGAEAGIVTSTETRTTTAATTTVQTTVSTTATTTATTLGTTTTVTTAPPTPQAVPSFPEMEAEVLRLMNEQREMAGVEPLTMRYEYYDCAETRVKECLVLWSHTRPDGRASHTVYGDFGLQGSVRVVGENLAWGYSTPEAMVEALMASPGHRRNILHEVYDSVAISIVEIDGEEGRYAMSQLFMATKKEECV